MLTEQLTQGTNPLRTITVYSTAGGGETTLQSSATTWEELTSAFRESEIDWKNMRVVEGNTEITYYDPNIKVSSTQKLPELGNLVFFMAPVKVKSGADFSTLAYWACRRVISEIIEVNENAPSHFNQGRNYTNKSTLQLRDLLTSWFNNEDSNCLSQLSENASNQEKLQVSIDCLREIEGTEDVVSVLESISFDPVTDSIPTSTNKAVDFFAKLDLNIVDSHEKDCEDKEEDYDY